MTAGKLHPEMGETIDEGNLRSFGLI